MSSYNTSSRSMDHIIIIVYLLHTSHCASLYICTTPLSIPLYTHYHNHGVVHHRRACMQGVYHRISLFHYCITVCHAYSECIHTSCLSSRFVGVQHTNLPHTAHVNLLLWMITVCVLQKDKPCTLTTVERRNISPKTPLLLLQTNS